MAIWLFRAGKHGEYEEKFLNDKRIYLTWDSLNVDLRKYKTKKELFDFLLIHYGDFKRNTVRNWLGQIWPIAHEVKKGDWIVLPSKLDWTIHVAEVTGDYQFESKGPNPFYHYCPVKWLVTGIPRSNFDQDILYSLGAFLTVCRITRNNAEERIKEMAKNGWRNDSTIGELEEVTQIEDNMAREYVSRKDLEQLAYDQITKQIATHFKAHEMERLIEAILKAKGFTTWRTSGGPDKGVDILAATGQMGFGSPRLCVQVKSGETPVDRPTQDQLIGAMQNVQAEQGLLVSWGGFKNSVEKEIPAQFFRVRLWGQKEIISELLANYDKLDDDIKAEIPLKRTWMLNLGEEE